MGKCTQKRSTRQMRKNLKPRPKVVRVRSSGPNRAERRAMERDADTRRVIAARDEALAGIAAEPVYTPRSYPLASLHDLRGMTRAALKRLRRHGGYRNELHLHYLARQAEYERRLVARMEST